MADGRWQMANGKWQMADGRWQMANGRWQMEDGRWQMADGRWNLNNSISTNSQSKNNKFLVNHYKYFLLLFFNLLAVTSFSQEFIGEPSLPVLDYTNAEEYEIGGIKVTGTSFLDQDAIVSISGLKTGDKIKVPGDEISNAIKKLWKQGILGDVSVMIDKIQGKYIFLEFVLMERPRLSKFSFTGIRKGQAEDLREKIKLIKGRIVTETMLSNTQNIVKRFFIDKGFLNTIVTLKQIPDTTLVNSIILKIKVKKNKKVKINKITFSGNKNFPDKKLRRKMKNTREKGWYKIFTTSRFIKKEYEADKNKVIEFYNENGYRDATLTKDTVYTFDTKSINIDIKLYEGKKYYFRTITWTGNFLHSKEELSKILGIKKGEVYNSSLLEKRLNFNPNGLDISSLYLDDGYLFFNITPVEIQVENDSIDIEMRIYEGSQATVNNIIITGNSRTSDHVIRREIRTLPGQKFSRSDLIRSQRELAQLGFFDQEKIGINPIPDPQKGTVDIEYSVEEKPSDQLEFSGGWGGYLGFVGSVGLSFNNFSLRKTGKLSEWTPLPSGDGQKLSLRTQLNGRRFQLYSFSFTEPWFGGKKPNSFTFSLYHSIQRDFQTISGELKQTGYVKITGITLGLGKRIKWPDDYFTLNRSLSYQLYNLHNYESIFVFKEGTANNISINHTLARNSLDVPAYLYPRKGSSVSLGITLTPPYSLFDERDYNSLALAEKYKWIEYHKWRFDASWFIKVVGNLVLNPRSSFGYLGRYKSDRDVTPFERFYLGGSGLYNFSLDGREIVALRGYDDNSIIPEPVPGKAASGGGTIFDKFTLELRYPISLNPMATVYLLTFAEAGNNWNNFAKFNPFQTYRSAGGGIRLFLPMFGVLGFDIGYGFDELHGIKPGFIPHFIIGFQQ